MLEIFNFLLKCQPFRIVDSQPSAYRVYFSQHFLNRLLPPSLQGIVQAPYNFSVIPRRVFYGVAHDQKFFQIFADVQTAGYCLKIVYGVRLLIRERKYVSR